MKNVKSVFEKYQCACIKALMDERKHHKVKGSIYKAFAMLTYDGYTICIMHKGDCYLQFGDMQSDGLNRFLDNIPSDELHPTGRKIYENKTCFVEFINARDKHIYMNNNYVKDFKLDECKIYQDLEKVNLPIYFFSNNGNGVEPFFIAMPIRFGSLEL